MLPAAGLFSSWTLAISSQSTLGTTRKLGIVGRINTTRNAASQVGRSAIERKVLPGATRTPIRRPNDEFSTVILLRAERRAAFAGGGTLAPNAETPPPFRKAERRARFLRCLPYSLT